ncbi:MAG: hypothetical protein ABI413_16385 [Ktedonobacteraceae bacterium]
MSVQAQDTPQKTSQGGRIFGWLCGLASFSILGYLLFAVAYQMIIPPPASRLVLVQDIPLPSGLGPGNSKNPLAPGIQVDFDGMDFQTYDAASHRLFIAHSGPSPDLMDLAHTKYDIHSAGHVVVFDTQQDKVIARIPLPQVAGVIDAPDLHKVFAGGIDPNDPNAVDTIYDIDVNTLQFHAIHLIAGESPDAITYDPTDHRIFVSDPGAPPTLTGPQNPDRKLMNIVVIDAITDKILTRINFGSLPLLSGEKAPANPANIAAFGYDVGHSDYDAGLRHVYVTSQVLPDADNPDPYILPPPHTAEFISINAVTMQIDKRITLPAYCGTPHGMAVDAEQHVAFAACTDFDAASGLYANLIRINLQTMTVIPADPTTMRLAPAPDIVRVDHSAHLVFMACAGGVTIFDETPGKFHRLGTYEIGKGTHSIAINEQTQEMYFTIFAGGLPILRIARYNPNGG